MRTSVESLVVVVFTEAELRRLRALLDCYESPFCETHEADEHAWDIREHNALRQHIAALLSAGDD